MKETIVSQEGDRSNAKPIPNSASADKNKLGSVEIEIREVDLSRPARSVNRMWPNR